jgi:hypothetical protein
MKQKTKRILTDIAGYGLILLGIATGWLPGPGGIPLILAGLGLLSIHNTWAMRLRDYLLENGGKVVQIMFPNNRLVQILYDLVVVLLIVLVGVLAWRHAAMWQISLAIALFFIALLIAGLNGQRATRLKNTFVKH